MTRDPTPRLEAAVDGKWQRLQVAIRRKDREVEALSSRHYLDVVDAERALLKAVDKWQRAKRGQR